MSTFKEHTYELNVVDEEGNVFPAKRKDITLGAQVTNLIKTDTDSDVSGEFVKLTQDGL